MFASKLSINMAAGILIPTSRYSSLLHPLEVHRVVLGTDEDGAITAMYGTEPRHPYWKKVLDYYRTMSFVKPDGSLNMAVVNEHLQEVLVEYGYVHKNKYQELEGGDYSLSRRLFSCGEFGARNQTPN